MLKFILQFLISRYSIEKINDTMSEIFYDKMIENPNEIKYIDKKNKYYDEISEAYDLINSNFFKDHHLNG